MQIRCSNQSGNGDWFRIASLLSRTYRSSRTGTYQQPLPVLADSQIQRLSELASNCTVSCLIMYIVICATYLKFFQTYYHHRLYRPLLPLLRPSTANTFQNRLEHVKNYGNASEAQVAMYDRDNPRYPYKSHGQWLKACYGLVACTLLVLFNGVGPFLEHPFDTRRFIASYIGVGSLLDHATSYLLHTHSCDEIGLTNVRTGPGFCILNFRIQDQETRSETSELGSGEIE